PPFRPTRASGAEVGAPRVAAGVCSPAAPALPDLQSPGKVSNNMDADDGPAYAAMDPEQVLAQFGRELRLAREARGLTRDRLAKRCGLSVATIKKLETGGAFHPRLETMVRLADGLDMTLLDLVRSIDPKLSNAERAAAGSAHVWLAGLDEASRDLVLALVRVLARAPDGQVPQPQEA